jgi:RNA polymerase sigma-70 factor (ECF subfamily)
MKQLQELFQGCKKRDSKSQRMLFDMFKSKLMGVSRRYTRNHEEAQDVLQEAFIKIFNKIDQLEKADKLAGWMSSIVVRTAINHYHKTKPLNEVFMKMEDLHVDHASEVIILNHFDDQFLLKAINSLPDGCRLAFNLHIVEGYSHAEIAEMMNVSEGTSRSQVHYAKSLLREKLKEPNGKVYYEKYSG